MKKLRKTFTCLILFSAILGFPSILVSCSQSSNKQKQATDAGVQSGQQDPQKTSGATPEMKSYQPGVMGQDVKKNPNNPNSKMLNAYSKNSVNNPGPTPAVFTNPDQKKANELYLSGSKKSNDGDERGAIEDFTQSLNLYKIPLAYLKRGFAELVLEDYNSALNDFNETIKIAPVLYRAHFGRAVCRFEMKDFKNAEDDLNVYIEKDKTTAMAYNYLAGCRFMKQDFKGALENYDMVVKLDPKFPDIYTNRGMMKHYLNNLKGAVEDYDKALAIDPNNATAYNNRGGAKLNQQDFKGALEDFDKAISLKHDYADAYDNRAKAKINLGDNTGACEDWHKAYGLGLEASRDLILKYCN